MEEEITNTLRALPAGEEANNSLDLGWLKSLPGEEAWDTPVSPLLRLAGRNNIPLLPASDKTNRQDSLVILVPPIQEQP